MLHCNTYKEVIPKKFKHEKAIALKPSYIKSFEPFVFALHESKESVIGTKITVDGKKTPLVTCHTYKALHELDDLGKLN